MTNITDITIDYTVSTGKIRIITENNDIFTQIRNYFSEKVKNAHFARRANKFAAQRKYIITPSGVCELGIYWELRKFLIEQQLLVNIIISDKLKRVLECNLNTDAIFYDTFAFKLRDYQQDVVQQALKTGRGLCILGTGAGKTFITAALIENYYKNHSDVFKCLVIVPDLGLVSQTYDEFIKCGITFNLTKWTGSCIPDMAAHVIICNMGILQSQFEKNEWTKYVDLLIVDECIRKDTILTTNNGLTKIQDIKVGDNVLSYNTFTQMNEYKPVVRTVHNNNKQDFIKITSCNNKTVTVTANHKIYTTNRGYVRADQLNLHDDIITI